MRVSVSHGPGAIEPFGKGFAVLGRFEASFEDESLPYAVTLGAILEEGRFSVISLTATRLPKGPPVTSEGVRRLPIATLLQFVAATSLLRVERTPSGDEVLISPMDLPDLTELAVDGPTDEVLGYVALIYRIGYAVGNAPTREVVQAFGISRATAGRWIAQARELEYLGPAEERRAGEKPSPRRKGRK